MQHVAAARVDLGLTADEFYELTPRQFSKLMNAKKQQVQHDEYMLAQLTAVVGNFSMVRPKEPFKPSDFMLTPYEKARKRRPRINRKRVASQIEALFASAKPAK